MITILEGITIGAPAQYLSYSNTLISQLTCCTSKGAGSRVHYPLYCRFQPHPLYSKLTIQEVYSLDDALSTDR